MQVTNKKVKSTLKTLKKIKKFVKTKDPNYTFDMLSGRNCVLATYANDFFGEVRSSVFKYFVLFHPDHLSDDNVLASLVSPLFYNTFGNRLSVKTWLKECKKVQKKLKQLII